MPDLGHLLSWDNPSRGSPVMWPFFSLQGELAHLQLSKMLPAGENELGPPQQAAGLQLPASLPPSLRTMWVTGLWQVPCSMSPTLSVPHVLGSICKSDSCGTCCEGHR